MVTGPTASCPSCGAPIDFRWAGAVQTTCEHCQSILVRHDLDLEKVGVVSHPPPATSPIQLGTAGRYEGRPFTVVGRIAYAWERGHWSEWHIVFGDGRSGWLSDALEEYAVTFLHDEEVRPREDAVAPGREIHLAGETWEVMTLTGARYAGVEGELPFEYWDQDEVLFADLRSRKGGFATLDYSGDEPLLFVGESVTFESLRLDGLRPLEGPAVQRAVRTLNCPNCGAGVTVHEAGVTVNVVCDSCASVLDARSEDVAVLQTFEKKAWIDPSLPLGSTGAWKGAEYRVLGFQERTITVEGTDYSWHEYLLFSRERGFRYLTEYNGHWSDVVTLTSLPEKGVGWSQRPTMELHGETFKHFQAASATTTYVLGEWPWEVRVGDVAAVNDYIAPPRMLSSEVTEMEKTWSLGEYTRGKAIWASFDVPGSPPSPHGVYANQPSPVQGAASKIWGAFGTLMVAFLAILIGRSIVLGDGDEVLSQASVYAPGTRDSSVLVMGPFELDGRPSNLQVGVITDVDNNWIYFNYSLLNLGTGESVNFGREVGYWHGRSGGESWKEGSRSDRALIPTVPAGEYLLRVEPEGPGQVLYTLEVRRDVRNWTFYILALLLLLLPPLYVTLRHVAFESTRWSESDYAPE